MPRTNYLSWNFREKIEKKRTGPKLNKKTSLSQKFENLERNIGKSIKLKA